MVVISSYLKRITKKDLYKVLRCKYPLSFQRLLRTEQFQRVVIFRETIDLLENYDQLLWMLKNDKEPTHLEYPNFTYEQHFKLKELINSLRYSHAVLSERDYLDFFVFRKITEYLGLIDMFQSSQDAIRNLNGYFGQAPLRLCRDNDLGVLEGLQDHEIDLFLALLEKLKPKVLADTLIDEEFALEADEVKYEQKFKKILSDYKQIYVLCLDVMVCRSQPQNDDNYAKLYSEYADKINKILQKLSGLDTVIHYLVKLEPLPEFGLNLHLILIFNETKYFSENTFILKLKKELSDIFSFLTDKYEVRNWNNVVRENFNKKAVGLIRNSDLAAINQSWYWIFSYFFAVEQVIKFNLGINHYGLQEGDSSFQISLCLPKPVSSQINKFNDLGENDTKIFASRKHLAKPVQKYLNYADLTYSEYLYLPPEQRYDLLTGSISGRSEVFCETLKAVKPELFIIPNKGLIVDYLPEEYMKMQTRLGRMWFSIFKSFTDEPDLIQHLSKVKFSSQNVSSFLGFLSENWIDLTGLHAQPLSVSTIAQLNGKLNLLKDELAQYSLVPTIGIVEGRFNDLTKYTRYLLAKDVYILRIKIEFSTQTRSFNKTEQSPILTELLRVGQSAQPLCWLRGYFLRWDQCHCAKRQSRQTYADLTLFFEYQPKLQNVNLLQILEQYLVKFLLRYNEKKKLNGTANEIQYSMLNCEIFSPKTELRQEVLKIETIDTDLRKSFMKFYLPYFCFLDLFIPFVEIEEGKKIKRFTKGHKPKSKQESVKKKRQ